MPRTNDKPAVRPRGRNTRRPSRNDSNIFVILWEIIVLLFKKLARNIRKLIKKLTKHIGSFFKNIDLTFLGNYKLIVPAVSAVTAIALVIALIWAFTNKNAYEIYIGENPAGIIKMNKNTTEESLTSLVTTKISNDLGMKVRLNETLTIKSVHASGRKMVTEDTLLSKLAASFTYKVEALSVTLDGVEMALLKNEAEYTDIREQLISPYRPEGGVIVDEGFVENLATSKRYADYSEITPKEKAYERLSAKGETEIVYTVKSGDVMLSIANNHGTTIEEICLKNGIATEDAHKLKIGQQLVIAAEKPVLSVRIVEEVKYNDVASYETITQQNPNQGASYSRVLQQGKNGEAQVTAHITFINGTEDSREEVNRTPIVQPVNEIIEVGAG